MTDLDLRAGKFEQPGNDLHSDRRDGCLPPPSAGGSRGNARLYVKAETYPCAGHGVPTKGHGGVTRLGYLMTYGVVGGEYRGGPYPSRADADRALSAVPA